MNISQKLFHILTSLAGSAAMGCAYKGWSDEFSRKENDEIWRDKSASLRRALGWRFTRDEILSLSDDDLMNLGFRLWDEKTGIFLIPLWFWNYIAPGEEMTSIDGTTALSGAEIDMDVRGGCIAYGFSRLLYTTAAE
jgi:hypothetical protein